jgi:hypothetical protein
MKTQERIGFIILANPHILKYGFPIMLKPLKARFSFFCKVRRNQILSSPFRWRVRDGDLE